ncbi:MAG: recombinase family protein [Gemmatimonadetes bacterium]|nr:recombinase family protein [Gemmatimonadota bacterium]
MDTRSYPQALAVGQSYRAIAAHLTAEGRPTKQSGRWHHSTVAKVVAHGGSITRRLWGHLRAGWRRPSGRVHPAHLVPPL